MTTLASTGCVAQLDDWGESAAAQVSSEVDGVFVTEPGPDYSTGSGTGGQVPPPEGSGSEGSPSPGGTNTQGNTALSASCRNGVWDMGETDVDCGGADCPACGDAWSCEVDADCESRQCAGVCVALSCANGLTDANETDQDCGGACMPCSTGAGCYSGSDCDSGVCVHGACSEASCDDGVQNGEESDVDCGAGDSCEPCANGNHCVEGADCSSGVCVESLCVEAGCTDGLTNGLETDQDCGGPDCLPCQGDQQCLEAADCASDVCVETRPGVKRCSIARCDDGVLNGREADTDCGGPDCQPCADGGACYDRSDCASSVCDRASQTCAAPSCADSTLNGLETGVDCGGPCQPCGEGAYCLIDGDCLSGVCSEGTCRAASCFDGERNQSESDVDCGGECAGCAVGASCETGVDCRSGACSDECLPGVAGRPCADDRECISGSCTDETCDGAPAGGTCSSNADCTTQYCAGTVCGRAAWNAPCTVNSDCATNQCEDNRCAPSGFVIETDGGTDTSIVDFKARVQSSDADPARQWRDLAFLYFFTAEAHDDFVSRYYSGPDFDVWDERFLARSFDGRDWAMIWRAAPTNTTVAPSTVTTIVYQVRNDPWATFTLTNDYSFRSGFGPNGKVVVCQRVDERWVHTQGIPPTTFSDPCALVVDTCAGATGLCDPLMRTQ